MSDKVMTLENEKIFNKFSINAKKVIIQSYDLARKDKDNTKKLIKPKHLFGAILLHKQNFAAKVLEKLKIDLEATAKAILGEESTDTKPFSFHPNEKYRRIIGEAYIEAAQLGHVYVGCEHILLAIMKNIDLPFVIELKKSGLSYTTIKSKILSMGSYQPGIFTKEPSIDGRNMNQDDEISEPKALNHFGHSMVLKAENNKYFPIIGRKKEQERIMHILSRKTKNNPILVGEAGVGKTAVVQGLAQRIYKGDIPYDFKDMDIIKIDISAIIAGAKIRGDIEERLLTIMKEIKNLKNTVVFIDEIHMIVGAGSVGANANDVANIMKPFLTEGDLKVIGATTPAEYAKYFEEDAALSRRFQPVMIDEISIEDSIKVLKTISKKLEKFHRIFIPEKVIESAVKLSSRYVLDRFLPDKAIDLIDEAAAKKKISRSGKNKTKEVIEQGIKQLQYQKGDALSVWNIDLASNIREEEVKLRKRLSLEEKKRTKISKKYKITSDDIREIISNWTKIPVTALSLMEIKSITEIENKLSKEIIGQKDAIEKISSALKRAKLGFSIDNRPLASMLFLGPTGVGKTESAKVIARELFGSDKNLIQVNMSEYMEQHSVSKIIGAPPGYVGYSDGNHITEQVRQNPYSVILFDEIEKAHSELINILLQVLEEGEVNDSKGRKVSFKNCVIIMTSNIGAEEIAEDQNLGFDIDVSEKEDAKLEKAYDQMRELVMSELKDVMKPEFINRLDEIIVFRGINKEDVGKIAKLRINEFKKRLKEQFIDLDVTYAVVEYIAKEGYSKEFGARNIKRKVQEIIENSLADFLLEENLVKDIQEKMKKDLKKVKFIKIKARIKEEQVYFELEK